MKTGYCKITHKKGWNKTLERVREWLASDVDYVIIIADQTIAKEEIEESKAEFKDDRLVILHKTFRDNIPEFRNEYLREAKKLGIDWIATSDGDEAICEAVRRDMRRLCKEAEAEGYNQIGLNARDQFEVIDWLYMDHLDELKECFDKETEVLSREGWKYFENLKETDEILTLNLQTKSTEFQVPQEIIKQHYEGKMVLSEGKSLNFCITPGHHMLVKKHHDKYYKGERKLLFASGADLQRSKSFMIPRGGIENNGVRSEYFKLSSCAGREVSAIPMDDWLMFFGLWLGDGGLHQGKKGYRTEIYQSKYIETVRRTLSKLPFHVNEYTRRRENQRPSTTFEISRKQLYNYLSQVKGSIPKEYKDLPSSQLKILLRGFLIAEGWRNGHGYQVGIKGKKLADDIQEVALRAGYAATSSKKNDDFYIISISNRKDSYCLNKKLIDYSGMVYCATVPNGTLLVRRKGRPLWSGNCPGGYRSGNYYKFLLNKICCDKFWYKGVGRRRRTKLVCPNCEYEEIIEDK